MADGTRSSRAAHGPPDTWDSTAVPGNGVGAERVWRTPGHANGRHNGVALAVYGAHWHTCEHKAAPLVLASALALDTRGLINKRTLNATIQWKIFRSTPPCKHGGASAWRAGPPQRGHHDVACTGRSAENGRVYTLPLRGTIGIGARGRYTGGSVQAADQFACAVGGLARAIKWKLKRILNKRRYTNSPYAGRQ